MHKFNTSQGILQSERAKQSKICVELTARRRFWKNTTELFATDLKADQRANAVYDYLLEFRCYVTVLKG